MFFLPRPAIYQKDIGTVKGKHQGALYRMINGKDFEVTYDEEGNEISNNWATFDKTSGLEQLHEQPKQATYTLNDKLSKR